MRILLLLIAWLAVGLGIIGIFLPVLPTTPFMILAAALFARTSPRFEQWLIDHPRYGKPLTDWRREGAIARKAKIASISLMTASYGIVWFAGPQSLALRIAIGIILLCCAVFVLTRSEPAPGGTPPTEK
ncbi:YbaN family protein [Rhizobium sp. RU36D]|uniref:YbaN family protein n=1 Tax=Rhizobium sp. RU36D TaxID=1907415 RepID=UPI0009D85C3D|nr:YbaN family protein [Rhizobium sp. RU36D]SMC98694.1 hypothetical protein SAMN05880593_11390 [Rhizobium sp. RU36D]